MRKLQAMLLTALVLAVLLCTPAGAETPGRDASWYYPMLYAEGSVMHLLTDEELTKIAQLPSEDVHRIVESMFGAAAGVAEKDEIALWKTLKKAEREARSAENALYRAETLPWLQAVYAPGNRPEEKPEAEAVLVRPTATAVPAATATPRPAATQTPDPQSTATPVPPPPWTPEDGYLAFTGNGLGQAYLAELAPLGGTDALRCVAVSQAVVQRWLAEIDHEELADKNNDYRCWIYAPDTPIDYPVVQCGNNKYYLDRLFNRRQNPAGTLFIDYRNLPEFQDPNTLIYGHHMRDSSMFHSLTDYETKGFYEAHPFMVFASLDEIYVAEVFAGYVTDGGDHCYDIAISDEEDMRKFVTTAQRKSNFDAHVEINCKKDHLVTLSTCAYNFDNARYILICRLDLVWERRAESPFPANPAQSTP